jgi:hypothetical protein
MDPEDSVTEEDPVTEPVVVESSVAFKAEMTVDSAGVHCAGQTMPYADAAKLLDRIQDQLAGEKLTVVFERRGAKHSEEQAVRKALSDSGIQYEVIEK